MRERHAAAALAAVVLTFTPAFTADASNGDSAIPRPGLLGIGTNFGRWPDGVVSFVYNPTGAPAEFSDNDYFLSELLCRE